MPVTPPQDLRMQKPLKKTSLFALFGRFSDFFELSRTATTTSFGANGLAFPACKYCRNSMESTRKLMITKPSVYTQNPRTEVNE